MQPGTSTLNGQVPTTGLSVTEAAQVLGVSPNTVRARIKAGKVRAERAQRPQGEVIRVFLVDPDLAPADNIGTSRQVQVEVPAGTYNTSNHLTVASQAEAIGRLVQEAIGPVERERDRLLQLSIDQAEQIGRLRAQLEVATSHPRPPGGPTANDGAEPTQTPSTSPKRAPWWAPWRRVTS